MTMSAPSAISCATSRRASSVLAGSIWWTGDPELRRALRRLAEGSVESRRILGGIRHIGRLGNPRIKRAPDRPTRPSNISEGQPYPPRFRVRCRLPHEQFHRFVVHDLVPRTMPQWPFEVYSHKHTSVTSARSGTSFFTARRADCTTPCLSYAPDPTSSFAGGFRTRGRRECRGIAPRHTPGRCCQQTSDTPRHREISSSRRSRNDEQGKMKSSGPRRVSRTYCGTSPSAQPPQT